MPEIGTIKKAGELNYKGFAKYIYHSCGNCGRERWVRLIKNQPAYRLCPKCIQLGHVISEETKTKMSETKMGRHRGEKAHNWKGGKTIDGQGYIMVKLQPDSFFYSMTNHTGYIKEHRLIVAKRLGRCLQPWEIVHHKDHIKSHNKDDNLEIVSDIGHKQLTMLEAKIDEQSNQIKELKEEIRLLRWQNKQKIGVNSE